MRIKEIFIYYAKGKFVAGANWMQRGKWIEPVARIIDGSLEFPRSLRVSFLLILDY